MSMNRKGTVRSAAPAEAIAKEGWLHKIGGATKGKWQARWCRLQGRTLLYYSKKEDAHVQGSINVDEVMDVSRLGEHAGKQFCFSMVATKAGNKKVYYFAAGDEPTMNEWCNLLSSSPSGKEPPLKLVKYATAEVFLTQGIRIAGDVPYNILSAISRRTTPDKKKRDAFGWFCDCPVALAMVLNLFAEYGWSPERIYRSTGISVDNTIQPVIRVILAKSPLGDNTSLLTSSDKHDSLCKSGHHDTAPSSVSQPVTSALSASTHLLEGCDDELIDLMQEFDIPLTLLQVPSDSS